MRLQIANLKNFRSFSVSNFNIKIERFRRRTLYMWSPNVSNIELQTNAISKFTQTLLLLNAQKFKLELVCKMTYSGCLCLPNSAFLRNLASDEVRPDARLRRWAGRPRAARRPPRRRPRPQRSDPDDLGSSTARILTLDWKKKEIKFYFVFFASWRQFLLTEITRTHAKFSRGFDKMRRTDLSSANINKIRLQFQT